jgi:DNA gyrase subunit A
VRRNDLSDFKSVMSNGKIAIKLDEDDALVAVRSCSEEDHVLLCSKEGKAVRFPVTAVRVFKSRTSDGVRGMKLAEKDRVVSMTILHGIRASAEEREQYLKVASARRRASGLEEDAGDSIDLSQITINEAQIEEMAKAEEMILTITENGFGKRTSAFEYRVTDRGGSGVTAMGITAKNGNIVMSFPVNEGDQIMLMTDKGTLIRTNVRDIRICGRSSQGVIVFRTDGEKVISATRIKEEDAVNEEMVEETDTAATPEATGDAA